MLNIQTITITPKILSLIARIDEFKGAWRATGTIVIPPQKSIIQK